MCLRMPGEKQHRRRDQRRAAHAQRDETDPAIAIPSAHEPVMSIALGHVGAASTVAPCTTQLGCLVIVGACQQLVRNARGEPRYTDASDDQGHYSTAAAVARFGLGLRTRARRRRLGAIRRRSLPTARRGGRGSREAGRSFRQRYQERAESRSQPALPQPLFCSKLPHVQKIARPPSRSSSVAHCHAIPFEDDSEGFPALGAQVEPR